MCVVRAAAIGPFEGIYAWREAGELCGQIHDLCALVSLRRDFDLCRQLKPSAVSAMTNIAESFDCDSKRESARFLGISLRSTEEVQSLLYVALDVGHIDTASFDRHYEQARKTKALIGGFKRAVSGSASTTISEPTSDLRPYFLSRLHLA